MAQSTVMSKVSSGVKSAATRRKSASTTSHQEIQNPLYAAPWALFVAAGLMGQLLFFIWGDRDWAWLPQAGMIAATGALAYAGWLNTRARTSLALGHTLVTVVVSGLWLTLCSITGLIRLEPVAWAIWRMPVLQHPTFDMYIILGCSLAFAWNMRQGVHAKEARDSALAGETQDEWGEAGVPGVRGTLKRKNEYFLEGTLTLTRGATLSDMQNRRKAIESSFDWPPNSLTLLPGPRGLTSRRIKARVQLKDPLENSTKWPGIERNPKLTLLNPIKEGMRADGVISTVFVAKPEGAKHFLVQGMTGSGKTAGQMPILLECAYRGAVQIVIDTVSGIQMFGSIAPALQWLITDEGTARAVIRRIAEEVIPARMEQLARERKRNWDPTSSLKLLRLHVEEAWSMLDADELMDIAVSARKAGVQLLISLQRASHEQLSTLVREQLGTRMCYGLGGSFGTMVLDDEVLDAGADPVKWKDEQPGMHYMTRGGLSISEKATATRSFWDNDGQAAISFESEAASLAGKIAEMDEVTADAFGLLWEQHIDPVTLVKQAEEAPPKRQRRGGSSQQLNAAVPSMPTSRGRLNPASIPPIPEDTDAMQAHPIFAVAAATMGVSLNGAPAASPFDDPEVPEVVVPAQRTDEGEEDDVLMVLGEGGNVLHFTGPDGTEQIDFGPDLEDPDPELQLVGDPFAVEFVAPPPGMKLGGDQVKVSRDKLDQMMAGRLDQLRTESRSVVAAVDFTEVILESGWSRTMVYSYLTAWKEAGLLVKTDDNQYLIVRQAA